MTLEFAAFPPRHRRRLAARQHASSAGYASTPMTTSTQAHPTKSMAEGGCGGFGGKGGFGDASNASGLGHVRSRAPWRAKYPTNGRWSGMLPWNAAAAGAGAAAGPLGNCCQLDMW